MTRRRICEAALRLIARGRGADVSMARVAQAAGVSRQALYLHFADRSALLLAAIRYADQLRGVPAGVRRIVEAPTGRAAVEAMVDMQASLNPALLPLARTLDAARRDDPDAERAWQDRLAGRLDGCRTIVAALQRDGQLRPGLSPEVAADLLWTLTSVRTWEDLTVTRQWTADEYRARVTEAAFHVLLAPVAAPSPRRTATARTPRAGRPHTRPGPGGTR